MKQLSILIGSLWSLTIIGITPVQASQLIYQPINPNFGGYSANGNVLLNNANAQNEFTDPNSGSGFGPSSQDPLANFQESLNRQVLTLIARKVVEEAFGTDTGLGDGGTYTTDGYEITITPGTDQIDISITDVLTGDSTSLTVPVFTGGT